ncbi:hypothetical protein V6N13_136935 [Hibiscus sabdariffa]|uniref:TMEM205-like domain-containing protein n=2 Tax=Hibiscus sabdariffa TaxID=183260 RepID=A0ABR1ZCA1_9ROSI
MMNALALSLVLVSSAAAGVWSPAPRRDDVIVKDGHRVVVVEYDEDGKHNTKVSISSPSLQQQTEPGEYIGDGTTKEAASALPNVGRGKEDGSRKHSPGELICDAFGKCTHKVATALGKAKDKVSETAHEANKVKDEASDMVSETAHGTKDKVAETAHRTKGAVGDAIGKAKGGVMQTGQDLKERAKGSIHRAKDTVKEAKDRANAMGDDIRENVSEQVENLQGKAKEEAQRATNKAKTGASKLFDGLKYITSMEALNTVMGLANLLGLATAYGTSVWVTFISSYVLAGHLPRQQFGVVQSKIYPVYFRAMAYSIGLALLGHFLRHRKRSISSWPDMLQSFNLLSSLSMVLVNALYLEPKATKVMFERMKMEKEEGRGRPDFVADGSRTTETPSVADPAPKISRKGPSPAPSTEPTGLEEEAIKSRIIRLNERLKKLNTNSSVLNILTLMALTWHLVYLGQHLTVTC